ncbi:MAG: hypothetical protein WC749_02865 [Dehalococcoidia bacterium]
MHFSSGFDCNYCKYFLRCFTVDMTIDWGFCRLKAGRNWPALEDLKALEKRAKEADYEGLEPRALELGLYVPDPTTTCGSFRFNDENDVAW